MSGALNVEQIAAVAGSAAIVGTAVAGLFAWIARRMTRKVAAAAAAVTSAATATLTTTLLERIDSSDEKLASEIADVKKAQQEDRLEMAKQFGGNSNGLRQAVDGVGRDVGDVREKVANLEGRFEQHVAQSR